MELINGSTNKTGSSFCAGFAAGEVVYRLGSCPHEPITAPHKVILH